MALECITLLYCKRFLCSMLVRDVSAYSISTHTLKSKSSQIIFAKMLIRGMIKAVPLCNFFMSNICHTCVIIWSCDNGGSYSEQDGLWLIQVDILLLNSYKSITIVMKQKHYMNRDLLLRDIYGSSTYKFNQFYTLEP